VTAFYLQTVRWQNAQGPVTVFLSGKQTRGSPSGDGGGGQAQAHKSVRAGLHGISWLSVLDERRNFLRQMEPE
jgi:hypothetical protein